MYPTTISADHHIYTRLYATTCYAYLYRIEYIHSTESNHTSAIPTFSASPGNLPTTFSGNLTTIRRATPSTLAFSSYGFPALRSSTKRCCCGGLRDTSIYLSLLPLFCTLPPHHSSFFNSAVRNILAERAIHEPEPIQERDNIGGACPQHHHTPPGPSATAAVFIVNTNAHFVGASTSTLYLYLKCAP